MDAFRQRVAAILGGSAPAPVMIPVAEPGGRSRRTLRRGDAGELVTELQQRLGMPAGESTFGPATEAAVREFQRARSMVPDGIVGPKTWVALDEQRSA
jgi:peptidoglycan hydrolase-like protein with peptidoglycan-binding domain